MIRLRIWNGHENTHLNMTKKQQFIDQINQGYTFKNESIPIGAAMLKGEILKDVLVRIPLKTLNRHGLIAGATGTGKTKSLQVLAENLSKNSIPVLLMDIKGDLSGLAMPSAGHPKIEERMGKIGLPWIASGFPVEMLTISDEKGVRMRATVSEFGPVLMSKVLEINDTQESILALVFKYCDDHKLPLLDLKDLKKVLQFISNEGKAEIEKEYGRISTSSTGTIMRKIIELEQQGAERFFGEKSFEVDDLTRISKDGQGVINIFRLTDIQDRPKLFSTFMLCLLAEIYNSFPEEGDLDAPKLVIFIDEAHLIFDQASKALLDQIETIVKLIRSKGVGLFFVTQNPSDVPEAVLSQLGLKIQHALRAFTAKDRKQIKLAAENFPLSEYYDIDEVLTQLGIGEALVTVLNEKGIPTPLAATMMVAPQSRMDVLEDFEIEMFVENSDLVSYYNKDIDRESAYEILNQKIEAFNQKERQEELMKEKEKLEKVSGSGKSSSRSTRKEKSVVEEVLNSSAGRTVLREVTRGILGVFGLGGRSSRKKSLW